MITTLETYGKELVAFAVPIIVWALGYFFRARARLLLATPHTFTFLVQVPLRDAKGTEISPTQTANTQAFLVSNEGRATATKVELLFNWKPLCVNVWPPRHFEEFVEPDGRYTMTFDSLAPNEHLGCHLLSVNTEPPDLLIVRSEQCVAKNVPMSPQRVIEGWKRRLVLFLFFAGMAAVVYLLIVILQFLVLKTPLGY